MHENIAGTLDRAEELYQELMAEYDRSLSEKSVRPRAIQLTHEVCERLRSVLDRVARRYWDIHISPALSEADHKAGQVYFPITQDQAGFDSVLGRWRWKSVRQQHQAVYDFLEKLQPFSHSNNRWLSILRDIAVQGKHIDLVPQTRTEERRTTVRGASGAVSWNQGVRFSGNIRVMGAPINPETQRILPTPGVTETVEIWVSFLLAEYNVNAAGFCKSAYEETRRIAAGMSKEFGL